MSYKTLEVELENGVVHSTGAEVLPAKARALLTIISAPSAPANAGTRTLGAAMRALGVKGRGDFTDLSTNKRHLDDLGK